MSLGDYNLTETVNVPFNTFDSNDPSNSVTVTDLVATDIFVHKDGVEGTPTGITVSLNVGTVNGNHLAILDLSDTNDAGFYAVGSRYAVRMEGVTVDGGTLNAWIGTFSIGCTLRPATAGRTITVESDGMAHADLKEWLGNAPNALVTGLVGSNVGAVGASALAATGLSVFGQQCLAGTTSGTPTTTSTTTNITVGESEGIVGRWLVAISGAQRGERVRITAYNSGTGVFTHDAFLTALAASVTVAVIGDADVNVTQVGGTTQTANDNGADINTLITQVGTAGDGLTEAGGTGDQLTDITGPLSNISNAGSAQNFSPKASPNGFTITTGLTETNDEDSVIALDGTVHSLNDDSGTIDAFYEWTVGAATPARVTFTGYVNGNNDSVDIFGWNWVTSAWVQIGAWAGKPSATNEVQTFDMFTTMVGTGANLGLVRVRYQGTGLTSATVAVDQVFVAASQGASDYALGAIWFDNNGTTNTGSTPGVDGVDGNPVTTWAAVKSLVSNTGRKKIHVASGATAPLDANSDNYTLIGEQYTVTLGGQSIEGIAVEGAASITGIGTATVTQPIFTRCGFGAGTYPPAHFESCGFGLSDGLFTAGSAGQYVFHECYSVVAGSGTPDFTFAGLGSATGINNRGWTGGSAYTLDSDCTLSHEVLAGGGQTITTGGGNVEIRGLCRAITVTMSGTETVQIVAVTGPIAVSGTTTGTVNLYGIAASVADTTSGATTTDQTAKGPTIDGIKTKTDSLTFTKANEVDSNIQSVNDVSVSGTGAAGDEWGPT